MGVTEAFPALSVLNSPPLPTHTDSLSCAARESIIVNVNTPVPDTRDDEYGPKTVPESLDGAFSKNYDGGAQGIATDVKMASVTHISEDHGGSHR